jgi:hypothetical protein
MAFPVGAQAEAAAEIVYGRWTTPDKCNPEISTKVDIAELLNDFETYRNTCVTVAGYKGGRALFVRRVDARGRNNSKDLYAEIRLGLYGSQPTMDALYKLAEKSQIKVTGMAWTCDDLSDENTIMVMGYCHYTSGPIIGMASFEALKK